MGSTSGHIRMLVILVLFLTLLTIANIILSVVSITSWGKKDTRGDYDHYRDYYYNNYGKDKDDKTPYHPYPPYPYPPRETYGQTPSVFSVSDYAAKDKDCYTIAFGDDWHRHEFVDESDKYALKGWGPAIALAACEAAGIKCKIVHTPYSRCFNYFSDSAKNPVLGDGIHYEAIDACGGWFPLQARYNVAAFTDGYIRNPSVYLWYRTLSGAPTGTINIGFPSGYPWDEKCLLRYLQRLGYSYNQLILYGGEADLYNALQSGAVQLAFLSDLSANVPGGFPGISNLFPNDPMRCAEGDAGLVTRKCEWKFIQEFNKGLMLIKHNGVFKNICSSISGSGPDQNGQWCSDTIWA